MDRGERVLGVPGQGVEEAGKEGKRERTRCRISTGSVNPSVKGRARSVECLYCLARLDV